MEQLDRLLKNAYLFEDPRSYQAGVRDTIAMFENAADEQHEQEEREGAEELHAQR